jgi:GGDEF domain-containing protein
VAADEVMRVITLLIRNAVREHGGEDDFIGHLAPEVLVVVTSADAAERIKKRLEARLEQSREIFYPLRDREKQRKAIEENHLRLSSGITLYNEGPFESPEHLRDTMFEKTRG